MAIRITGFRSRGRGRPVEIPVGLLVAGTGTGETLTITYGENQELSLACRPVGQLAGETRRGTGNDEYSATVVAYLRRGSVRVRRTVTVWMRVVDSFGMLTFELPDGEQVSVPFAPVEKLIRENRSNLA